MAYDRDRIHEEAIEAIKEHGLTFFDEISLYVEPTLRTLYEWEFHESQELKRLLLANKLKRKSKMRKKWEDSDNATLQLAAYKLIADAEELERLTVNNNKNQHSGDLNMTWNEEKTYEANSQADQSN